MNNQTNTNPLVNSYTSANASTMQTPTNTATTMNATCASGAASTTNAMNTSNKQQGNQTIIGVFENRSNAETAVAALRQQGFTKEEINIISKKQQNQDANRDTNEDDGILDGTLTGGAIGGIGGLILGAGALMIPGIGPIIAAGPIAAALGGAVAGGITGGLIDWGIPADESQHYEQEVIAGSILAIIRTDSGKVTSVAQILRQNGAKEVKSHNK